MKISEIRSIENLEALGPVAEVRQKLEEIVSPLKVEANSYQDLFSVVQTLQKKWVDFVPGPFVNRKAEVVFYLTRLDGEVRNRLLGLTEEHFRDPKLARKWHHSMRALAHSDREGGNDDAYIALEKIWSIVNYAGDEDE
ncbi:hypothetical protein [Pseudomonas viridiflava]|uniref:hypothetical protein n=1 Tax=Pseudomonas viridiflava TaxID=33069 RepID=UPI001C31A273|nr:hypothetical protein [Pseudomonas viridiflava]QXG47477.1 hypothetical protein KTT57_28690 [Pseudomonas viridiflava]